MKQYKWMIWVWMLAFVLGVCVFCTDTPSQAAKKKYTVTVKTKPCNKKYKKDKTDLQVVS